MKLTNYLINKFGSDKLLHFLTGCALSAIVTLFAAIACNSPLKGCAISLIIVIVLAYVKEVYLDDEADFVDFLFSVLGFVPVFIVTIIASLL